MIANFDVVWHRRNRLVRFLVPKAFAKGGVFHRGGDVHTGYRARTTRFSTRKGSISEADYLLSDYDTRKPHSRVHDAMFQVFICHSGSQRREIAAYTALATALELVVIDRSGGSS